MPAVWERTEYRCTSCLPNQDWRHLTMTTYAGMEVTLHAFVTSALYGSEWSASRSGRVNACVRRLGRPHRRSPCQESEKSTVDMGGGFSNIAFIHVQNYRAEFATGSRSFFRTAKVSGCKHFKRGKHHAFKQDFGRTCILDPLEHPVCFAFIDWGNQHADNSTSPWFSLDSEIHKLGRI
jgi:hypothetical protein